MSLGEPPALALSCTYTANGPTLVGLFSPTLGVSLIGISKFCIDVRVVRSLIGGAKKVATILGMPRQPCSIVARVELVLDTLCSHNHHFGEESMLTSSTKNDKVFQRPRIEESSWLVAVFLQGNDMRQMAIEIQCLWQLLTL